jgi:diguanylate cyclase
MDDFSPGLRQRADSGQAQAINVATARIVAATQGDLATEIPHIVSEYFPELATALDGLLADVRANLDRVSTLAMFDPVTSLPNRIHFRREAECLLRNLPENALAALLFVDLDNFKAVNDTYGHAQGDQLLALVADRLRAVAAEECGVPVVGRLAGDEFTLLFPAIKSPDDAARIGCAVLSAMTQSCNVAGHSVDVGASIGIALSADVGCALPDLMRAADVAMYHAKTNGRRQYQFYTEALAERLAERIQLDSDLRAGIARNELALMVQPQVSLVDGALIASEALLRWNHPTQGQMMPHKFLPAADESGLIFDISDWSLVKATQIAADWTRRKVPSRLAINLGSRQMNHADFFPRFHELVAALNLPMSVFEVEVTEDNMMECGEAVIRELTALRSAGAVVTIDTAGIGMSSLAQLRLLPVDRLKIHRSVITEIAGDTKTRAVVQAMIGLGHGLGCEVIAAGVETVEQIDILRVMGCDAVQGYAIAPPMSLDAFTAWRSAPKTRLKTPA